MPKPSFRVPGAIGLGSSSASAPGVTSKTPQRPTGKAAFENISRDALYDSAMDRSLDPSLISQRGASLCGPAAFFNVLATHRAAEYYKFVTELYEKGESKIHNLHVKPGADCKKVSTGNAISPADWVALAGLRDSENTILDYDDVDDAVAGITLPSGLADWFKKVGFISVLNETNLYITKGESNFKDAVQLQKLGHEVCLFIDMYAIDYQTDFGRGFARRVFTSANHWVILRNVKLVTKDKVQLEIYTWGQGAHPVPYKSGVTMTMENWLNNYYGFVSCQP